MSSSAETASGSRFENRHVVDLEADDFHSGRRGDLVAHRAPRSPRAGLGLVRVPERDDAGRLGLARRRGRAGPGSRRTPAARARRSRWPSARSRRAPRRGRSGWPWQRPCARSSPYAAQMTGVVLGNERGLYQCIHRGTPTVRVVRGDELLDRLAALTRHDEEERRRSLHDFVVDRVGRVDPVEVRDVVRSDPLGDALDSKLVSLSSLEVSRGAPSSTRPWNCPTSIGGPVGVQVGRRSDGLMRSGIEHLVEGSCTASSSRRLLRWRREEG